MRKALLLTSILTAAVLGTQAQPVKDSVQLGAGYANQVWYSLDNDEQGSAPKNNWDLAFDMKNITSSIHINSVAGTTLWNYPKGDASAWSSTPDTAGINTWTMRWNSDSSWSLGAMGNYPNPNDATDLDWGKYNLSTHIVTGDSIYIIKLANGAYKKLMIESLSGGIFTFKYANLDGTDPQSNTITKSNFAGKNFAYFSLQNNAALPASREPNYDAWDLIFTPYTAFVPVAYTVTGVLHNRSVSAVKVTGLADKNTYVNWYPHNFSTAINTIGYNWKVFNGTGYDIKDSTVYFITAFNGDIWKLMFTGFASADGKMVFTKEKITPATVESVNEKIAAATLYPNPSSGKDVTVVYDIVSDLSQVQMQVVSMTGNVVYQAVLDNSVGLHQHTLPSANFAAGVYIVSIQTGKGNIQQKLIVY
jgi:hypothetical protein